MWVLSQNECLKLKFEKDLPLVLNSNTWQIECIICGEKNFIVVTMGVKVFENDRLINILTTRREGR